MKNFLILSVLVVLLGCTGCSYQILHPAETSSAGLPPEKYPGKIVVSVDQKLVFERTETQPGEKASSEDKVLAEVDKQGVVRITEKEIVIKKNTPGVVDKVSGDEMQLNFGQPRGAKEGDPEIIITVKLDKLETQESGDDVYTLKLVPLPGEDPEYAVNTTVTNTNYVVKEGRKAKVTYKKVRSRKTETAKGKKPGS